MLDQEIARALKEGTATVERVRRLFVEQGAQAAIGRKRQINHRPRAVPSSSAPWRTRWRCSPAL